MRKQQEVWIKEHQLMTSLPVLASSDPDPNLVMFVTQTYSVEMRENLTAVDIGCGKGRNTMYLAQSGMKVTALDYAANALEETVQRAREAGLDNKVTPHICAIDETWPFHDSTFDLAVDCFSSINIETPDGRQQYKQEVLRTLKPGGYVFTCVVSAHDELQSELSKLYPGPEQNSTIWPNVGKFQKNYSKEELLDFYQPFEVVSFTETNRPAFRLDKHYISTCYYLITRKPD